MNLFDYKLDKKINIDIDGILFFLDSYFGRDIKSSTGLEILKEGEYSFNSDKRLKGFKDILALNYIGAIELDIINYDARANYKTNIDLSDININTIPYPLEDYLYKNFDKYIKNIEQHSFMTISISFRPYIFIRMFMKIIFQEQDISKLANYSILDNLINRIKSEINGKSNYLGEIEIFYNLSQYLNNQYSIYPILIELEKLKILVLKEIELREGYLIFKIEKIVDINSFDKEKIINLFGSTDNTKNLNNNLKEEITLINIKIDFRNGLIKNNGEIILKLTDSEKEILIELNRKRKEGGISKENLRILTNKPTDNALNQSIKLLKKKLYNSYAKEYIIIEYKKGERIYYLTGKYFKKVEKK